jgi:hypothetical protein
MFGKEWTSEYYDVMEFYYWEPQHLGKIKNPKSQYSNQLKSLEHIQNMEVSLNHMFNVFFRLAPSHFTNTLLNKFCNTSIGDQFFMQGRYDIRRFSQLVQPDLLFTSDSANFSIEMKIGAKSSLEQVYKYALLHWLEQEYSGIKKKSILLYIGKNDFQSLWVDKFKNPIDVINSAIELDISNLKNKGLKVENIDIDWDEVKNILSNTIIGHCNYSEFSQLLSNNKDNNEVTGKLFNGLISELDRRGIA